MGFLGQLFSGIDDVARGDLGMLDDLGRMDFHGAKDRMDNNLIQIMENDALRTVGLPIADYFSFGLASQAAKAKYNKLKYGQSGFNFGDLAKSVAGNYIAGKVLPGTKTSSLGDVGYNVAAGAGRGAISAGVQGESMTEGAKGGAIQGGLMSGGSYLGDMFSTDTTSYVPRDANVAFWNDVQQRSSAPPEYYSTDTTGPEFTAPKETYGQSYAPAYAKTGTSGAYNAPAAPQGSSYTGNLTEGLSNFLSGLIPTSRSQMGDMAQGLLGMYSGYRRSRAAKEARGMMGLNRGAYEANLRQQLARRDAAAGKRSNYAGREVELQAALAQLDSRNAPALTALDNARYGGLESMFRSGLHMGNNLGWFGAPRLANDTPIRAVRPLPPLPQLAQPQFELGSMNEFPVRSRYGDY